MARLMLVTHYAGTKTVKVYRLGAVAADGHEGGLRQPQLMMADNTDVNNVALKSEGTYYLAGVGH